jgi:hypothetical protein
MEENKIMIVASLIFRNYLQLKRFYKVINLCCETLFYNSPVLKSINILISRFFVLLKPERLYS